MFSILLLSMLILQCLAGLLALLAAVFALANIPHKKAIFAGLLGPLLLLGWWVSPHSYQWRFIFWSDALAAAWSHPWGIGPGNYYLLNDWPHAHNVALNLIAENGLPGLLAVISSLAFLAIAWRTAAHRPPWAVATLAAFGLWCLLDTPTQVLLPPTIAMLALSTLTRNN